MSYKKKASKTFSCLNCLHPSTKVIESRDKSQYISDENRVDSVLKRVRKCPSCGQCFDTEERIANPPNVRFRN